MESNSQASRQSGFTVPSELAGRRSGPETNIELVRRDAPGLDADVPMILRDGTLYDANLDRFLLDLRLNGVRSRHTIRAYSYDLLLWVRFLTIARHKSIWAADRTDLHAFHRARLGREVQFRISKRSWNRSVATLVKAYRWAESEGLVASGPFNHRVVQSRGYGRRPQMAFRNEAYERGAQRSNVRFIQMEDFRTFRDVGLRGLTVDGHERQGARDRNGSRNALFAELITRTGMRLGEASHLLASELTALVRVVSPGVV